jgi:intracellular sulfur oxidation DsrE/DsrF family protein
MKRKITNIFSSILLTAAMSLTTLTCVAQDTSDLKPFAEVHVVLQLSDQLNEAVVLDVANNLIKNYGGPDVIDIEIVTFGKGVRLMFAGSEHETRIASLVDNGVRFYVCENTLDTIERKTGVRPELSEHAEFVRAGVARIIDKVAEGFTLVRP